ncbi:hypothetical protein [Geobacter sp.]|uniref:hypothetical protein n=1 Tax=Geobacter sp. TaxID=46610 RepID=UPI0027B946CA|nr:hypothetical protein [Geobacter sp.]
MAAHLSKEIIDLFADTESTKVLATLDEYGVPHVVVKQSLHVGDDGNLLYLELLESSRTNKNLVRSIWFDRKVSVAVTGRGGQSYLIKGRPVKTHITGPVFQQHYQAIRERLGDVDLAAVWVIEPEEILDETFVARKVEEELKHPLFTHLDRLVRH